MDVVTLPNNIDEAVDTLIMFFTDSINDIKELDEDQFVTNAHMNAGMFIRNTWYLWWSESSVTNSSTHTFEWPQTKPNLNKWFNDNGITHADDMSSIIFTCLHRKLNDKPFDIEEQIKHYQDFWKENGYPDGIPKIK